MGHTHSCFILATILEPVVTQVVDEAGQRGIAVVRLNVAKERATRVKLDPGVVAIYIHVDDWGCFSIQDRDAERVRDRAATLPMHGEG